MEAQPEDLSLPPEGSDTEPRVLPRTGDELKLSELLNAAESLVSAVNADSQAVKSAREAAESTAKELATTQGQAKDVLGALGKIVESAQSAYSNLDGQLAKARAANIQSDDNARQASASIESAKQMASSAAEMLGRIEGIRDEAVKTQATIAERNAFIQDGLEHVGKVQRQLDAELDRAKRAAEASERALEQAQASLSNITAAQSALQVTHETAESNAAAISANRTSVEGHAAVTKRLSELAESTEARVAAYENDVRAIVERANAQQKTIDEHLVGATNAGLASAFDKRSKTFRSPQTRWQIVFVASLVLLLFVAIWHAYGVGAMPQIPDWEQLTRLMLMKLPFVLPLVWLAIHAARQATMAKRMEEEYGFKATTSMSFEGYRRQMADVGKDLDPNSPLSRLCDNTLRTIASPPSHIYDKQRMDPTPGSEVGEIVRPIIDGVGKPKDPKDAKA